MPFFIQLVHWRNEQAFFYLSPVLLDDQDHVFPVNAGEIGEIPVYRKGIELVSCIPGKRCLFPPGGSGGRPSGKLSKLCDSDPLGSVRERWQRERAEFALFS